MQGCRVYTIGYGGRPVDEIVQQLREHEIEYLIDVRSAPYSRFQPEFSRVTLARLIREAGLKYGFMGDQLGGRPKDPDCYDNSRRLIYKRVRAMPFFEAGIARITEACDLGYSLCLICAEANPERCHRAAMIGVALQEAGVEVVHLLKDGSTKSQQEVMFARSRGQHELFPESPSGQMGTSLGAAH